MKKAYFQYYETFETVVQKIKNVESQNKMRQIIINYGLYGIEPESLSEIEDIAWIVCKEMIDQQLHRREVNRENARKKTAAESPAESAEEEKTENNDIQEESVKEEPKTEGHKKEPAKTFKKPTAEEVEEYCRERNNGINAQQFVDFYESKGWKIGSSPMKDWKASVRTWENRAGPKNEAVPADKIFL